MPEIIDWDNYELSHDEKKQAIAHFIIEAVTLDRENFTRMLEERKSAPGPLEVKLTINGIEFPFSETLLQTMGLMQKDFEKSVARHAAENSEALVNSVVDKTREIIADFRRDNHIPIYNEFRDD